MKKTKITVRLILTWFPAIMLAGCTTGPDFRRPSFPEVANYTETPLSEHTTAAPGNLAGV